MPTGQTAAGLLREGAAALKRHRCAPADAARDAELLLMKAAGLKREDFFVHGDVRIETAGVRKYRSFLRRRLGHEPMAYILGTAWFRGREFQVDRRTLIPRWATESLIISAMRRLTRLKDLTVLDVGTGNGCIAVSLAAELQAAEVIATDISAPALKTARANGKKHLKPGRVRFLRGDLAAPAMSGLGHDDRTLAVMANLPYIPAGSMKKLPPDIRLHEPKTALDGGRDGLDGYRRLISQLAILKRRPILLFWEINPGQYRNLAQAVMKTFPGAACSKMTNDAGIVMALTVEII